MRSVALVFLFASLAVAQERPDAQLTEARRVYDASMRLANASHVETVKKITKQYVEKLEGILAQRTKSGNLDGALEVRKLIESASQESASDVGKWSPIGVWMWGREEQITFHKNGYATNRLWDAAGLVTRWKMIGPRTVLLFTEKGRDNNRMAVMFFNDAGNAWTGLNFDQSDLSGVVVKQ